MRLVKKDKKLTEEQLKNHYRFPKGYKPWNTNLTTETSEKLRRTVEKAAKTRTGMKKTMTKQWKENLSLAMKERYRNGLTVWNKGRVEKSTLQTIIRHSAEYFDWRSRVFYRDDFTCQTCDKRGDYLNADHIKTFASIFKEHNIKTLDDAVYCKELWNINNGRTLCKECHILTDSFAKYV